MQRLTLVVFVYVAHYYLEENMPASLWFCFCTSLIPRPMVVVFDLGTRVYAQCVQNYKIASFTMDSNHRVLWMAFIDQGQFEATKMLSRHRAPCCDKHQFCAKMMVNTQINSNHCLAVFRKEFGQLYETCWSRRHNKLLVYLWWSYTMRLLYCIYCVSYMERLSDNLGYHWIDTVSVFT